MTKRVLDIGNCAMDHSTISDLIRSNFGAEVQQVHGGQDALGALRGGNFDLVLVNRLMDRDGAEGMEIIRQIKADAQLSATPVMMITNFEEHQRLAVEAGAEPGFGKRDLHSAATQELLQNFLA